MVDLNQFMKVYNTAGETDLIDLEFSGKKEKVLIKDVQLHPVSYKPIHASFFKVNLTEKIKANIPVEVVGEENCSILKTNEGVLLVLINEIEVEALPAKLPHAFVVDVSGLTAVGQTVDVKDLNYNKKDVELVGLKPEDHVVKIDSAQMVEVEETVDEAAAIASVEATQELSEEEKAARAAKPDDKSPTKEK